MRQRHCLALAKVQLAALTSLQPQHFSNCRALFGDEKESITTLWAWQHMLQEARWFGRALYDAEELIMRQSRDFLTEV